MILPRKDTCLLNTLNVLELILIMKYKKIKQNVEILRSRCQPANQSRLPLSCRWVPTCCYHIQLEISQSDYLQIKLLHNFNSSKLVDVFLWLLWFDNVDLIAMIICRYLNATSCALTSPLADAMHFKIRIKSWFAPKLYQQFEPQWKTMATNSKNAVGQWQWILNNSRERSFLSTWKPWKWHILIPRHVSDEYNKEASLCYKWAWAWHITL